MKLTLAEELLLLILRDDTGKPMVDGTRLNAALAGAAIVELTLDGALRLTGEDDPSHPRGRLVATGTPASDPRLSHLLAVAEGRRPKDAVSRIGGASDWRNRAGNLKEALLEDLAEAGLLTRERSRILGLFPTTSWKPADPGVEAELLQRVAAAVVGGANPGDRTAAVISLLNAVDALPKLFPDADKGAVKRRGRQIGEGDWAAPAVRKAVQEVNAVMIAVMASTSVAATAGS
ncbi:GOLPH3/VPS74 family protein [Actinocorallia longicatena]|uniref:Golgi phosphoprotein 3 GPP34 n=1 Tax=Actinocorallia longicatena TaxID=111803 RepID=A0ABP6QIG7_9ACTN